MRPVIFLDIDGVVVTPASVKMGGPKAADPSCVSQLSRIVDETDAEIVISSSWRIVHSIDFIRGVLTAAGLDDPGRIIGATRHLHYRTENGRNVGRAERRDEIIEWLRHHGRECYVIIDDEDEARIEGRFVHVASDRGLSAIDADRAISILASCHEARGGGGDSVG